MPALIEEIVAVMQPLADKNGNRLEKVCAPEVGERALMDASVRRRAE